MIIKSLELTDFRNYKSATLDFSAERNLLFGENAQGKTNVLEAVFYLSCLKTFRGSREADAIRQGQPLAKLSASFDCFGREILINCDILKTGRRLFVNGIPIKRPSEHIGLIKTVVFSPDDLRLIKDGPALRRRFLNIAISQMRPSYIKALSEHNKIIETKRKILKMETGREAYYDYLDILNEKLSAACANITYERGEFIKLLRLSANETTKEISRGSEEMEIIYNCDSAIEDTADKENREKILYHLNRRKEAELASGMCLVGSHRDDFTVYINGNEARSFASQGQIRSCVLALKCAEHSILEKDSGESPIFLLDDVLSELDPSRREFLINDASRGQTIITGCDPSMFSELKKGKIFTISGGEVVKMQNS